MGLFVAVYHARVLHLGRRELLDARSVVDRRDCAYFQREGQSLRASFHYRIRDFIQHHFMDVRLLRRDDHLSRNDDAHGVVRVYKLDETPLREEQGGGKNQPPARQRFTSRTCVDRRRNDRVLFYPARVEHEQADSQHDFGGYQLFGDVFFRASQPLFCVGIRVERRRADRALAVGNRGRFVLSVRHYLFLDLPRQRLLQFLQLAAHGKTTK